MTLLWKQQTIAIEGNIACGKSTIIKTFESFIHSTITTLSEPLEEWTKINGVNLLQRMYDQPALWATTFQSYALLSMIKNHSTQTHNKLNKHTTNLWKSWKGRFSVPDFVLSKLIVQWKLLTTHQHTSASVLIAWFDYLMQSSNINLDLIIYIRTTPEVLMRRIKIRNRCEERTMDNHFLNLLHKYYDNWLLKKSQHTPATVIILNGNDSKLEILKELDWNLGKMYKETTKAENWW